MEQQVQDDKYEYDVFMEFESRPVRIRARSIAGAREQAEELAPGKRVVLIRQV